MKAVRCGSSKPTPYLRKVLPLLPAPKSGLVLDLGCGNLRNTLFAKSLGFKRVVVFDRAGDYGTPLDLAHEPLPVVDKSASLILCNYLMCFFNEAERLHIAQEIDRVSASHAHLVVEMYPAKGGFPYDIADIRGMFKGWDEVRLSKDRFVLRKGRVCRH